MEGAEVFKTIMISIILFSVVVTGFIYWASSSATAYNVTVDNSQKDESMRSMDETLNTSMQMSQSITQTSLGDDATFSISAMVFSVFKLAFNSIGVVIRLFTSTASLLHIPAWLLSAAIACLMIIFVFAVVEYYKYRK